ncbi:MAG TPA: hypothetical protein VGM29_01185 [Polyangiaceae bacterium]|jgi:hypothetical protein
MRPLTANLAESEKRPYFLWDEDVSIRELRHVLSENSDERRRLLGKMLREARDTDVWQFVTPNVVAKELPFLGRRLGKRAAFWSWLIDGWRRDGLLEH